MDSIDGKQDRLKNLVFKEMGVVIALILLCIIVACLAPSFLKPANLINILQQISISFIIAVGSTFVILTGGIDLSVGSIVAVSGFVMALLVKTFHFPIVGTILIGLFFGALMGFINGFLISKIKLPAFIATLGMMSVLRGVAYTLSNGQTIFTLPPEILFFAKQLRGVLPVPVIIVFIVFAVAAYILKYTRIGRYIYAVGGNETASNLSGVDVNKVKIFAYTIAGFFCSLSSLLLLAKLDAATPTAGEGYEMEAISAVVIGGTSMSGGEGGVLGTLFGALIIGVISNGMNLCSIAQGPQKIVKGLIIVLAVTLDILRKRNSLRKI